MLISGSLAVQAALGETWTSDIDIFCTWEAAPHVRQCLIEKCRLICSGSDDPEFGPFSGTGATVEGQLCLIDHVEEFLPAPKDGDPILEEDPETGEDTNVCAEQFYAQAVQYGSDAGGQMWASFDKGG